MTIEEARQHIDEGVVYRPYPGAEAEDGVDTATEPGNPLASRFREAREYLGLCRDEVAARLGWTDGHLEDIESGSCTITGYDLRRMARLYRRPIGWFTGEWEHHPDPDMVRQLNENERLTEGDRQAVLDFAEFLAGAGPASKPRRDRA